MNEPTANREPTAQEVEEVSRAMARERVWAATLAVAPTLTNVYSNKTPALEPGKFTVQLSGKEWAASAVNLGLMIANAYAEKMQELEAAALQQASQ